MDKSTTVSKLLYTINLLIVLVLVLLPFHAFLTVWLASLVGHYTLLRLWKEILLVVLVIGALYLLAVDRKLRASFVSSRLNQLIILYGLISVAWGIAAYSLHKVTLKALAYGLAVNLRFLVFFLVVWVAATKSQYLKSKWRKLLLWPAALVIVIGLAQRFFLPFDVLKHFGYNSSTIFPYETINHNTHYPRIMSTLRGANPLGAYMVLIISALSAVFIKMKKKRWQLGVLWLGAFAVLILSYSRGAWAGSIAALAVVAWAALKSQRAKRLVLWASGLILVVGAVSALALKNNSTFENIFFHTENNSNVKTSSNQGHESALHSGIHDVSHEPLGRGVGTAGPASVYNNGKTRIAENYYIQLGQEVGWLGLALFAVINYLIATELWVRRGDALSLALFASFIGLIIINLLSHAWADDTLAYIWWGLAGLVLAGAKAKKPQKL